MAEHHRVIILVRHGAADEDGQLTEVGAEQATLTANRLAALPRRPDRLVHSPLPRAAQTAAIIAATMALPAGADDVLAECIPSVPPEEVLTERQRDAFATFTAAEREEGAQQAAAAAHRYLGPPRSTGTDLLITHGNLLRWLTVTATGAPGYAWIQLADYNCGITVLSIRAGRPAALLAYNDTGHLPAHLRGTEYPPELRW